MKYILFILLVACGQNNEVLKEPEPLVIETFELPPIACNISIPGMPPMVVVVPWSEAGEFENSSEYIDCRFPGETE